MYDYRIESMEFMCTKLGSFPIIKAHMSHTQHTNSYLKNSISKRNDQCVICSISECIYLSFFFEIFARFVLKIEQIT